MKKTVLFFLLALTLLISSCASNPRPQEINASGAGIIQKDYNYQKTLYGTHIVHFEIHLENTRHSAAAAKLVEKLIYQNMNFDQYSAFLENRFIEIYVSWFFPQVYYDDGKQYLYESGLIDNYYIRYHDTEYIIVHYDSYCYNSGAAHGIGNIEYYIIDIAAEKILTVSDIITQIPESVLFELIKNEYDINFFLRDNIWPPDFINIKDNKIFLLWNVYTISAYVTGPVYIELLHADRYLTEKGKEVLSKMRRF